VLTDTTDWFRFPQLEWGTGEPVLNVLSGSGTVGTSRNQSGVDS